MNMIFTLRRRIATFNNLKLLNDICAGQMKIKPIEMLSGNILIIKDPIDFYLTINKLISGASRRVALSSLYLGTGSLERYLVHNLTKKMEVTPRLQTRLLFDYYRSHRIEKGQSGLDIIQAMHNELPKQSKSNLRAGYLKSRNINRLVDIDRFSTVFSEIVGVHHMKIYIFDDDIIVTGANLSHSYFTYRQDRYIHFRSTPELSDYAYDLVEVLIDGSARLNEEGELKEDKNDNILNYFKMWRFGFKSSERAQEDQQPKKKPEEQKEEPQKQSQQEKAIVKKQQTKKQDLRQKLAKSIDEGSVAMVVNKLKMESKSQQIVPLGQKVYVFPVTQVNMIGDNCDQKVLKEVLSKNVQIGSNVSISSGYMNFPKFIVDIIRNSKIPIPILTSSPEANSFFQGGRYKRYIPYFYRVYERRLLRTVQKTAKVMQYRRWGWTFHTKGIWIREPSNDGVLSIAGSSNFNMRSYERDTQFQVYIYSRCPDLNKRLQNEWDHLQKSCKEVTLKEIQEDKQMKLGWFVRAMSWMFSRFM